MDDHYCDRQAAVAGASPGWRLATGVATTDPESAIPAVPHVLIGLKLRSLGLLLAAMLVPALPVGAAEPGRADLAANCGPRLPERDDLTIAVTDSGLGGLAIMAEIAARLETSRVARRVQLVFFNALFSNDSGYNSLPTREARIRMFDRALTALADSVRPDLIVIGCNTLSVIYPDTAFARGARVPVAGIIEPGVALFRRELARRPDATLLLFGTETTMGEGTHRAALVAAGVPAARVVPKACPELAAYIETNWQGDDTELMIAAMAGDAVGALPAPKPPVFVGLVCSHYGYARGAWPRAVAESGAEVLGVLDPNRELVDALCPAGTVGRHARTAINARVVTMVEIAPAKLSSLGTWLQGVSPVVAAALANYELRSELFEWRSVAGR